jgi:hypothetical protein
METKMPPQSPRERSVARRIDAPPADGPEAQRIARRRSQFPKPVQRAYGRCLIGEVSPRTAIKLFCLECLGERKLIATCTARACPLWAYRPYRRSAADEASPDGA